MLWPSGVLLRFGDPPHWFQSALGASLRAAPHNIHIMANDEINAMFNLRIME
jgi:hypothetical protein